ncbi:MAG: hypothetical protein ACKESB_01445, partial [Candidatus Hodgkinia cicadicola]
ELTEAFLCGKTKRAFQFRASRLAEALTAKVVGWCLGKNLSTSKTCNGIFIEGENLNSNLSKPEGVSVKHCEMLICIAYLLMLAWPHLSSAASTWPRSFKLVFNTTKSVSLPTAPPTSHRLPQSAIWNTLMLVSAHFQNLTQFLVLSTLAAHWHRPPPGPFVRLSFPEVKKANGFALLRWSFRS